MTFRLCDFGWTPVSKDATITACNLDAVFQALNASKWRIIGTRGSNFVAHLAVIVTPEGLRGSTRDPFRSRGISTAIHYPILDYHQPRMEQLIAPAHVLKILWSGF